MAPFITNFHVKQGVEVNVDDLVGVPLTTCEKADFEGRNSEDKGIVAMLLVAKKAATGGDNKVMGSTHYNRGFSRQRISTSFCYDTLFTFADLNSVKEGRCFTVFFPKRGDVSNFMKLFIRTHEGVGNLFFLREPDTIVNYVSTNKTVPIVKGVTQSIPLCNPVADVIPEVPLQRPERDCTRFFALHNRPVCLTRAQVKKASCSGEFCDRQGEAVVHSSTKSCACIYVDTRGRNDVVVSMDVTFDVPNTFEDRGKTIVKHFQSWRTSKLFVKDKTHSWVELNPDADIKAFRQCVNNVCNLINENGGWSIVGWMKTGSSGGNSTRAAGNQEEEIIESLEIRPNISYLYPSKDIAAFQELLFQKQYPVEPTAENDPGSEPVNGVVFAPSAIRPSSSPSSVPDMEHGELFGV